MDEIKVVEGEYVKTKTGKITRLIKIDKKYVVVGHGMHELQVYSKFENSHYIYANNYEELYEKINKYITKHSFNIKELIEENDIVEYRINCLSELKVGRVKKYRDARNNKQYLGVEGYDIIKIYIETILTHEQYERDCYKIN